MGLVLCCIYYALLLCSLSSNCNIWWLWKMLESRCFSSVSKAIWESSSCGFHLNSWPSFAAQCACEAGNHDTFKTYFQSKYSFKSKRALEMFFVFRWSPFLFLTFPLRYFLQALKTKTTSIPSGTSLLVLFLLIVSDLFSIITNSETDF